MAETVYRTLSLCSKRRMVSDAREAECSSSAEGSRADVRHRGGRRGRSVVVIEHNGASQKDRDFRRGRCNFTNLQTTPANFISSNPHFAKSALSRYTPLTSSRLGERHRIPI